MATLRDIRKILKLSQSDMARLVAVKRGTYSAIECGHRKASGDVGFRLNVVCSLVDEVVKANNSIKWFAKLPWYKKLFVKFNAIENPTLIKGLKK